MATSEKELVIQNTITEPDPFQEPQNKNGKESEVNLLTTQHCKIYELRYIFNKYKKDSASLLKMLQESAAHSPIAALNLAKYLLKAIPYLQRDEKQGLDLVMELVEKKIPEACFFYAILCLEEGSLDVEAIQYLKMVGDFPPAITQWGNCYLIGRFEPRDFKKAYESFCRAEQLGDIHAIYHQGRCFEFGWGVLRKDMFIAICLYEKAMKQGCPFATLRLAKLYGEGYRDRRITLLADRKKAFELFQKVELQGIADMETEKFLRGCNPENNEPQPKSREIHQAYDLVKDSNTGRLPLLTHSSSASSDRLPSKPSMKSK